MQHQQGLSTDEGVHGPQRMLLVVLVAFDVEAVVVTEVHGEDVICHVGHTVPDDKVGGQPVPGVKKKKNTCKYSTSVLNFLIHASISFCVCKSGEIIAFTFM